MGGIMPVVTMKCKDCGGGGWEEYQSQSPYFANFELWKEGEDAGEEDGEEEEEDLRNKKARLD